MVKGFLEKYRLLPIQVKASLWFVVSNVLVRGISFITLPIFARLLTTEDYGIIGVYQSWVSIISIITTLTIWGGVFNVGMVKYEKRIPEMISSFQGMAVSITLFVFSLTMLLYPLLQNVFRLPRFLVVCAFTEIVFQIPFNLWSCEQRYQYKYKLLITISFVMSFLNPIIGYCLVVNSPNKAEARIIGGVLVQTIIGLVFFFYNFLKGKKFYSLEFWKWGFIFNIVLVPHYLSMQVLNQADRIMISGICGDSDAGVYNVAYTFAMLLSLVTSGINSSLTPHIYQSIKSGNADKLKTQTTALIGIVAILAIGLIAFIPDVFHLLLPESYYSALKCIPPVTAGAFFLFLYPLFGAVEFYYEENKYVTFASIIGAMLNIFLNFVFIRIFGYIAAAYTTLFCYICFSVCHYIFMKRIMRQKGNKCDIYDIKAIILISLSVIFISVLMVFIYDINIVRWIVIVLILLVGIIKRNRIIDVLKSIRK